MFCENDSSYVWRCRNNENCNVVLPLADEGWKMWETWELLNGIPAGNLSNSSEISIQDLVSMMDAVPLKDGYILAVSPFVLPLSLTQYFNAFLADDAPYFYDKLLAALDNTIIEVDKWTDVASDAPAEKKEAFGVPVLKTREFKISTQTGNPLAPTCNSDVTYLLYKQSDTQIDSKTISFAPDQYLADDFKYLENWEVLSAGPDSNQVVVRMSYSIDWLSHPFSIWKIMKKSIESKVADTAKEIVAWYPARANDFLDFVGYQMTSD